MFNSAVERLPSKQALSSLIPVTRFIFIFSHCPPLSLCKAIHSSNPTDFNCRPSFTALLLA